MTGVHDPATLRRELGVFGAAMTGLGAMIGTGIFVSVGLAAGAAGGAVIAAILLAAAVAACNALSSAQLAASHAVSGGTYEYGYRYLNHWLGFTAGWVFLCAKTASAATAALGFAGYFSHLVGLSPAARPALAASAVVLFTALVLLGIRRTSRANAAIVTVTLAALGAFIVAGVPALVRPDAGGVSASFTAAGTDGAAGFFYATALMFVAYTGYARIATLGEEVVAPQRNIPRAIIVTLVVTALLYVGVAAVGLRAIGAEGLAESASSDATPLEAAARALAVPGLWMVVAIGSVTAMLGVLLNLILGLSRVVLAMGRRGDLPRFFGRLSRDADAPATAVVAVGATVALLALAGSVETAWAFSAFTVLVYYAITNLAALRLPARDRRYPRAVAAAGLAACLFLAWWVPPRIWLVGLALIGAGLAWHAVARARSGAAFSRG